MSHFFFLLSITGQPQAELAAVYFVINKMSDIKPLVLNEARPTNNPFDSRCLACQFQSR